MSMFSYWFGVSEKNISPHCILSPLDEVGLFSDLGIIGGYQGRFFKTVLTRSATILVSRLNFLVGDCILALQKTPCQFVYLFGSCGSTGDLSVGDIGLVEKAYCLESVTEMLSSRVSPQVVLPDRMLTEAVRKDTGLRPMRVATVNSLLLEKAYVPVFSKLAVSCVDMECSIVLSASAYAHKKAAALLYVTDKVSAKPFSRKISVTRRSKIAASRQHLARLLMTSLSHARSESY